MTEQDLAVSERKGLGNDRTALGDKRKDLAAGTRKKAFETTFDPGNFNLVLQDMDEFLGILLRLIDILNGSSQNIIHPF